MAEKPIDLVIDDTHSTMGAALVDQDPDIAVGISLPITKGENSGYFHQEYLTVKQLRHNIRNLLLTIKGERVMQPTFGTNIYSILFEPDDGTLSLRVRESVLDTFKIWLPFVKLENLEILSTEGDAPGKSNDGVETNRNIFHINLSFSLYNDPTMLESISLRVAGPEI